MTYCYAQIIIDISHGRLDRPFTYRIPEALQNDLCLGSLVVVPFGKGDTKRKGYVIGFSNTCEYPDGKLKEIEAIASGGTDVTGDNAVRLALWMKQRYGSTMAVALRTVLTSRKQAKPCEHRSIHLLLSKDDAEKKRHEFAMKHQVARERLLRELMEAPDQPYSLIIQKLHVTAPVIAALKKQGILEVRTEMFLRNPVSIEKCEEAGIRLSPEQRAISEGVLQDFEALQEGKNIPRVSLIHGITGSGKTEVYIAIIEEIVKRGRQAIMLIPEISLTYQTLMRFYRHFGDRVSVMNSTLSESEKSDQFERARRGEIDVIIGPRSALFTPFPRIGAIIMDEEHESSYKNESMPKYHTREVAEKIASMQNGVVVLGSATPSLESYYQAKEGKYRLYELSRRLTGGTLPSVEITDLREELRAGNHSILSRRLSELVSDRLAKGQQTMLFLNRRGFSGFVSCRSCGFVPKCPHCSVSLSLHRGGRLLCHYCGYEEPMPDKCPECGSPYISGFHAGTEQAESFLSRQFPKARILRMDADTTRTKGSYEKILSSFANEEADILIGTQMIVKGHDFPNVTLVGILLADQSLNASDYRSAERTFQLLTQAAGRAGRGKYPGDVVIQTYEPEHYSIVHAAHQNYEEFYREEMVYRKLLRYPPAEHLLAIQIISRSEEHASLFAHKTRALLEQLTVAAREKNPDRLLFIGPAPAVLEKLRDEYRYVIYVKSPDYDTLIVCKDGVEAAAERAVKASREMDTMFQFDFDPINAF
ncbi:primosomal protein N' PriA [Firmicutes bacterium CAG:791]|nr:primosomal protein N' PriA [Firmicutes bacterium CAG:791]